MTGVRMIKMFIFSPHKSILFPIVPCRRNINTTEFLKMPATFTKKSFIITAVDITAKGINAIAEALTYNDILRDLSLTNTTANCRVHDHSMPFVALCLLIAQHLYTHLFLKLCFCELDGGYTRIHLLEFHHVLYLEMWKCQHACYERVIRSYRGHSGWKPLIIL